MVTRREKQLGSSAVLVAIMIPILLAGLGLVVDSGQAFDLKRRLQKAADAGAIAAAQELRRGHTTGYQTAALKDAALNGFSSSNATVSVLNPPVHGTRAGNPGYIEVRVRSKANLFFMKAFGQPRPDVEAFAIAGAVPADACLFTLDTDGQKALWASGGADVDLGNCGVHVNSSASMAARTDGGAIFKSGGLDIVGDYSGDGFLPEPITGSLQEPDPWGDIAEPTVGSCTYTGVVSVTSNMTLQPGVYCGGISVTAGATATLAPGNYMIAGGLKVAGGAGLTGNGVSFYLTSTKKYKYEGVSFSGSSIIHLSANTAAGPMSGILFFQDRSTHNGADSQIAGTPESTLVGGLYFQSTTVKFVGNGVSNLFKLLAVVYRAEFHGTVDIAAPDLDDGLLTPNVMRASLVQ